MRKAAFVVLLAVGIGGCESVKSSDVYTDSIYANLEAQSDGDQTLTVAILREGGALSNTYIDLDAADSLSVTVNGETQELQEQNLGAIYTYLAWFDATAGGTEFVFSLDRTVDEGAPNSVATLPDGFEITAPAADASFSRASDDIVVTWDATASDEMSVDLSGDCISSYEAPIASDTGTVTIPAGSLQPFSDETASQTCDIEIRISRGRPGVLDGGFGEGGEIWGTQLRSVDVLSAP